MACITSLFAHIAINDHAVLAAIPVAQQQPKIHKQKKNDLLFLQVFFLYFFQRNM